MLKPNLFFVCGSGTSRLPAPRPALPPCRPRVSAAAAASFRPPLPAPRPRHAVLRPPRAALRPPIPACRRAGRATATARVAATTTGVAAAAARCGGEPRPLDRIAAVGRRSSSPLQTGETVATLGPFQYQKHLPVFSIEYRKGWISPVQGICCTILWGASMQYITKLATSQSQKPRFPPLPQPKYNVMCYPVDAPVRTVKNSSCTQNSVARSLSELKPFRIPVKIYIHIHLLISVCSWTIQNYQLFSLGNEQCHLLGVCYTKKMGDLLHFWCIVSLLTVHVPVDKG